MARHPDGLCAPGRSTRGANAVSADDAEVPDRPEAAPQRLVWTTAGVPDSQRLEYWTEAVSSALFAMGMSTPVKENFQSFVESAPLDALVVTSLGGTRREAIRGKEYIGRSNDYSLHILVDFTKPWILRWRGTAIEIAAGQIVLSDTRYVHSGIYPEDSATGRTTSSCRRNGSANGCASPIAWWDDRFRASPDGAWPCRRSSPRCHPSWRWHRRFRRA